MTTIAPTKPKSLFDTEAVVNALRLLIAPGDVTELRILDATVNGERWANTQSGYFDHPQALAAALQSVKSAKGIYFVLNAVDPALLARAVNRIRRTPKGESTSDTNIVRRQWLPIDVDAQRPSGISATDAEHEAALERARSIRPFLTANGWPDPIAADSGNGAHLLYRIDLPADDGGIVRRCLAALAKRFDDDSVKVDQSVFNPARIWKLYGTLACKGDDTADRPHRMARVLSRPEELTIVSAEILESLAGKPAATRANQYIGNLFDLEAFIARNNLDVDGPRDWNGSQGPGAQWTFRNSPMCDHHDDGPFIVRHASGAITAGCHHDSCGWTWEDLRNRFEPRPSYTQVNSALSESQTSIDVFAEHPSESAANLFTVARPKIVFERITAAELDSGDYSIEYLIEDTMTAGQPLIVAGGKKQLKTNMLLDAAISLATGGLFLGILKTTRAARVGIMSGESGMATIKETCRRICKSKGLALGDIAGLIFSPDLPRLDDERYLVALEEFITNDELEVLIFDPAYLMMPGGDAGNLFIQGEMLGRLSKLCERLGVTMGLCHHTKKGIVDPYSPPELEDIAWAGFQEFARQWWLIGRREKYEIGTGTHALWLNIGGSAGHSALWGLNINEGIYLGPGTREWNVELLSAEEAREESVTKTQNVKQVSKERQRAAEVKACKGAILAAFEGLPDHRETLSRITERSGKKGVKFDEAISELCREGEIKPAKVIRSNGQSYEGYERVYPTK